MDKVNYETYEYMPASGSSAEPEPYQFFVVQDDGTFLINRQVQYVTQVQEDKEALEGETPCTMLDVAPQQFYVDIDTTTEMISVPDQFSIPEGTNNLYANSYLLQPEPGTPVEQIENNNEQLKANLQTDNTLTETNKQTQVNSLTEITLTDDQYHVLEQKGWILLEANEKVYVLDTLGLHDITNNEKLIQKLKTEDTATNLEIEQGQLKIECPPLTEVDMEQVHCVRNESKLEEVTELSLMEDGTATDSKDQLIEKSQWEEKNINKTTDTPNAALVENIYNGVCGNWKDENVLRIRTDFSLKDIPDKIVLGKTVNGKRLVCRVVKSDDNFKETQNSEADIDRTQNQTEPGPISDSFVPSDLGDDKLDSIFRMCFTENTVKYSTEDVAFAEMVIKQLVRLPAVKPSVANRNVLVTKVVVSHEEANLIETPPTLVTGEVVPADKSWRFAHRPDLYATAKDELSQAQDDYAGVDHNFLHIHIHEIRLQDIVRTSITLNKRRLEAACMASILAFKDSGLCTAAVLAAKFSCHIPDSMGSPYVLPLFLLFNTSSVMEGLELSSTQHSEKIFIPDLPLNARTDMEPENTMFGYACGTCAAIFRSEKDLNEHRENHKMDTDDKLTIDSREENYNKNGILVLADPLNKTRMFACIQCNAKFQRLNNCQRHVKTHMAPVDNETSDDKKRVYKCKICYSFFHHAPTLLKHIMKNHIKVDK